MDFNEFINDQSSKLEQGGGFNQSEGKESYRPKNPVLRLGNIKDANGNKTTKENAIVRVLPPAEGSNMFFKEFRATGINFTKKDGSQSFSGLTLPAQPGSSVVDPYITDWLNNDVQFSRFPNKPAVKYFIHVIEYYNNNGQIEPMKDNQGNVMIQPMEISNTGYKELLNNLKDPYSKPSPESKHSFISADKAFLVNIAKASKGEMSWKVKVYPNLPVGELPQGWENQLSDLEQLATPTEEQNPDFVNFLINNVNNTELSHDNFKFNRDTNTLGEEPSAPKQAPTQQEVDAQVPFGAPQQGQPSQAPQAPQQDVDWNNLASQQSQPDANPFSDFDAGSMDNVQVPFDTQPEQPQQSAPQQEQQQQTPPKTNQNQNIESVLDGLDLDNL